MRDSIRSERYTHLDGGRGLPTRVGKTDVTQTDNPMLAWLITLKGEHMTDDKVGQPQSQTIPVLPPDKTEYFNGFFIGVGSCDVIISVMKQGIQTLSLNTSYPVAKTFALQILKAIDEYEKKMGVKVMTLDEIDQKMRS